MMIATENFDMIGVIVVKVVFFSAVGRMIKSVATLFVRLLGITNRECQLPDESALARLHLHTSLCSTT